jgi:toxin ParE1/3/4
MIVEWSDEALGDLVSLQAYVAKDSPAAAKKTALFILESVEKNLPDHPQMGRPGRVVGTRELVISGTPYIVPYRLTSGVIEVLRVYHGARKWPDSF